MNDTQTSSIKTGAVTLSATALLPAVQWALTGFAHPIPEGVPYLIAAALMSLGHAMYNIVSAKLAEQKNIPAPQSGANSAAPTQL